jgi:hypothetical protein
MNDKDAMLNEEDMVELADEPTKLSSLPSGISDPELAKMPLKVKQELMPPVGSIVTAGPFKTPKGWVLIPFRVTYRNAAKLRISGELINKVIPVPEPPPQPGKPEDPSGRTTLAVQDGVMGGGSTFKQGK